MARIFQRCNVRIVFCVFVLIAILSWLHILSTNIVMLQDIIAVKFSKLEPIKTIFFIESTNYRNATSEHKLTARQVCAIESAAKHNPDMNVIVLILNAAEYYDKVDDKPELAALQAYENVWFYKTNLSTLTAGTPYADWLQTGALLKSSYPVEHGADFLRLLVLWHFGGLYLDTDVITIKSLSSLPANFMGAGSAEGFNNGVMRVDSIGVGHSTVEQCLNRFISNFDGSQWAHNGPGVITYVLKQLCNATTVEEMSSDTERCQGMHVMTKDMFYAVPWTEWRQFFNPNLLNQTLEQIKNSYMVHLWNKISKNKLLRKDGKAALNQLAQENCPKAYANSGEYF